MKKIQKKQMKDGGKPKDVESQEESENESKMSVKIKDENSSEQNKKEKSFEDLLRDLKSFCFRLKLSENSLKKIFTRN